MQMVSNLDILKGLIGNSFYGIDCCIYSTLNELDLNLNLLVYIYKTFSTKRVIKRNKVSACFQEGINNLGELN